MMHDYIVLQFAGSDELTFWRVPKRKATDRIFQLLSKVQDKELEKIGVVTNVRSADEAERMLALNGADMLKTAGVFRAEARN
jgi:hypothetical protein